MSKKTERLYQSKYNKIGEKMTIVDYKDVNHIVIEFDDEKKTKIQAQYNQFVSGSARIPDKIKRLGEENINVHGEKMTIIKYINSLHVIVEFDDKDKTQVDTQYSNFKRGITSNPNHNTVLGVGYTGIKYPIKVNGVICKEYNTWVNILHRCFDKKWKGRFYTYEEASCCKEWLSYETFYEWLHNQNNFNIWINMPRSGVDKDILIKGNKHYSPETCCLVTARINSLFIKANMLRGDLPIGVTHNNRGSYDVSCNDGEKQQYITTVSDPIKGFYIYKAYKEKLIKDVALEAYSKGEITKQCYEAMLKYEVEITD